MKRGELYRVAHPSVRDPKRSRVFVVVSRQVVIESRFSTVYSRIQELVACVEGDKNPDVRYRRWIAQPLPGRLYGGDSPPNAKVDFIVVGYRPKTLINHFSSQGSGR